MKEKSYRCYLLLAIALFLLSGCALGPKRIPADRFNYGAAIGQSAREQMLLNIVRSRYLETPVFLAVSSVVTQYDYNAAIGLTGIRESINRGPTTDTGIGELNLAYSERPTITYVPVGGQEFAAHLLSPIPSHIFFGAAQAGWPIDILMRIAVHRLGAAENMSFGEVPLIAGFPADLKKLENFSRMVELFFILSEEGVIEVQRIEAEDAETDTEFEQYLVLAEEVPADLRPLLAEWRQLTGVTNRSRFEITSSITNVRPHLWLRYTFL